MPGKLKYVYGPVSSWRLGVSLGVDPLSCKGKVCSFDCIYCQAGKTATHTMDRKVFVPADEIIREVASLSDVKTDYITFAGSGEPTLASNLRDIIHGIREIRRDKIAVITNSSLLCREDVVEDLMQVDCVVAKLDASSDAVFRAVNRPVSGATFDLILRGIKSFRVRYNGRLALQLMFMQDNIKEAEEISHIVENLGADEIQLNTPLRPCGIKPLTREQLGEIKKYFKGKHIVSVYDARIEKVKPLDKKSTVRRRGGL